MSASSSFRRARATSIRSDAGQLREAARGKAKAVAVTVDADDQTLDRIVAAMRPDMLQLHGGESPERVAAVKARYGLPVMKALSIRTAADLGAVALYRGVADRLMFDAKPPAGSRIAGRQWRFVRLAAACRP